MNNNMMNPKANCLLCTQQFFKSPISISNTLFLELSTSVADLIAYTSGIVKESSGKCHDTKNQMIIHFSQMISCLEFLSDVVRKEHEVNLMLEESRKVALNRIRFCLDNIERASNGNGIYINDSGQFLKWMDNALDNIVKINVDTCKEDSLSTLKVTKLIYEDILAHAMSIAQICLDEDTKAINGSCKSVLDALEDLQNELFKNKPNKAMVSLFVDDASNKLCSLERKVDVAVLRLSLFVFSQYQDLLEKLHRFCEANCVKNYDQEELDNIIVEYDLHVDRIFQIGLFAVICSSNCKSGNKIRNCMASLEFLESELVPAIKIILKDGSVVHRISASIYKNYWLKEAEKLKTLVYEIIDPTAFCKVICDEIAVEINSILEKTEIRKDLFENILNYGKVLVDFTVTVVGIEAITDEEIKDTIRKCSIVTTEIGSAIKVLEDNTMNHGRIMKRCRVLQAEVKKLLAFMKNSNKSRSKDDGYHREDNVNESKLIPSNEKENTLQNMTFSQIKNKGKEILDNRSIMYRTPKKFYHTYTDGNKDGPQTLDSILQRLSNSRMNISFRSSDENSSFSTNIADILTNLSKLTTS